MTKNAVNKDTDLKLLCKMLFEYMGYLTHYEIKLRNKSYLTTYKSFDISDIDVYGYQFRADLTFTSVGSECKSGESSALEELFKFLGIAEYYGVDTPYLIKTKIHQNAREVAAKKGIRCYSESELRQILLGLNIDVDKGLKIEMAKMSRLNKSLEAIKTLNDRLYDYITLDFWNKENWRNIHNLVHRIRDTTQVQFENANTIAIRHGFYYILELVALTILKHINQAITIGYSDIGSALTMTLFGGAESLYERRRLADLTSQITGEQSELIPDWFQDYINLCYRFSQATHSAALVPVLIKEIYSNSFYDDKINIEPRIMHRFPDLTRKFVQDLVQFLNSVTQLPVEVYFDLLQL